MLRACPTLRTLVKCGQYVIMLDGQGQYVIMISGQGRWAIMLSVEQSRTIRYHGLRSHWFFIGKVKDFQHHRSLQTAFDIFRGQGQYVIKAQCCPPLAIVGLQESLVFKRKSGFSAFAMTRCIRQTNQYELPLVLTLPPSTLEDVWSWRLSLDNVLTHDQQMSFLYGRPPCRPNTVLEVSLSLSILLERNQFWAEVMTVQNQCLCVI